MKSLALLALLGNASAITTKAQQETVVAGEVVKYPFTNIQSPFQVKALNSSSNLTQECGMSAGAQAALVKDTFAKIVCVWGCVVAGTATMPDSNLLFAANVLANLLDPNGTGSPQNEQIRNKLSIGGGKQILGGGVDKADENKACSQNDYYMCSSFQIFKTEMRDYNGDRTKYQTKSQEIIKEEAFHMYNHAIAKVFPAQFGDKDFTSVACKEMARLECLKPGWHHSENTCPNGNPDPSGVAPAVPLKGTCNVANCDCVEFFNQAVLGLIGQHPAWRSENMPTTQAGFETMLSPAFKAIVRNPSLGIPQKPFMGIYNAQPTTMTLTVPAGGASGGQGGHGGGNQGGQDQWGGDQGQDDMGPPPGEDQWGGQY